VNSPNEALERALTMFDSLVELSDSERASRLDALAQRDPPLAQAVAKLLLADAANSGVLDHGMRGMAPTLLTELAQPANASGGACAGMQIAAFTLQRPLGVGGMGEVWLAQRRDGDFVQDVALKLLKRGMDSEEVARRFVRERRILAELNHPHIARFVDGGISADGRLYYAMEYVEGVSITDYARNQGLSVRARVQLLVAACEAVAHAQAHLVVHRDLKPSNIMVDPGGQPRVLDFGIAKMLGDAALDTALTASGMRALSPAYAAPEQVLDEPISTATDVYSLGVIAFELLTGVLPHARSGNMATLAEQVRQEHTRSPSDVLRRSTSQGSAVTTGMSHPRDAREVAGDLDLIVLTALKREPALRYVNAAGLAADLGRWLEGRPIAAQADTAGYRMRKFVARNRIAVGSASAVLLALIAGLGLALWQATVARDQAQLARAEAARAELQTLAASEATERAKRVKDFMMQTFVQADPLRQDADAPKTVPEAFDDALKRVDSELAEDPILQIDVLDDFSEIRTGQGRFDEARVLVDRALALAEKTYPADHPAIAESLVNRGVIEHYSGGHPGQDVADMERAVAILERHADTEPLNLANALSGLSALRERDGQAEQALALAQRTLGLFRKHGKPGQEGLGVALHNNATMFLERGRYAEAEALSREAIAELTLVGGPDTPRLEPLLETLSQIQYRKGEMEEANATNQRRLAMVQKAFEGPHPWTAGVLTDIGQQQMEAQPEQAAATLDRAIAMYATLESSRILMPLRYRALVARDQAGDVAAMVYFDRAMAECAQRQLDAVMCDVIRANRAGVMASLGDGATALSEVDIAMTSLRARGLAHENEYAQALESKARAQKALGLREAAIATQTQALAQYVTLFGEQHDEAKRARRNLEKIK